MKEQFKPPTDPALHALWVIRNWTALPKGNMQSWEEIVRRVNQLSSETFEQLTQSEK